MIKQYHPVHLYTCLLSAALIITAGCSREKHPPKPLPPKPTEAKAVQPTPPPAPAIVKEAVVPPQPAKKQKPVLVSNHKPTIRITALMKRGSRAPRVGIVEDSSGDWAILRLGQSFKGYRVDEIDYNHGKVLLDWEGQALTLVLEGTVEKKTIAPKKPTADSQPTIAKMVYSDAKFSQTADEAARGIDPNDAATWPTDYRGPAIERIAAEMGDEQPQMDMRDIAPLKTFEPTADEISRGIDPNTPETWPKGYRGPAIERMAKERGENPASQTPMMDIPKPEGTPEEIRQRFFDKYAPKGDANQNGLAIPEAENKQPNPGNMQMPAK
jgi:hypothetical protein